MPKPMMVAGDQNRRIGILCRAERAENIRRLMTVADIGGPARRLEAADHVDRRRQGRRAIDGDAVVVPKNDQLFQLQMARQRNRFVADAFFQVAVAGDDIGLVVDQLAAETGIEMGFGQRHAYGIGDALAQGAGGGLDPGGMAIFGMAGGAAAHLPEILQLLQGHVRIAGQIKQRIQQHRPMTGRQHKAVPVGPMGIGGVEFQEAGEKHRGGVRHAHGQAWMTGLGLLHRIDGEHADDIGKAADFGLLRRSGSAGHVRFPGGW